ncbi:hypothetical protein ACCI51_14060 [Microbulbifer echini]|uniref:Uncharacterized protein n=1 Tax=Microbulbifer echini TaxID=1529067 RepID=A0ABV4NQJ7_9GAMM|nr:hypothetical protein [uncultured Microbulbifer sp.]
MFFRNTVKTVAVSVALLAFGAQAKTFKYELQDLNSSNMDIQYPGLDFSGVSSATLTIDHADQSAPPVVTSLEINFPSTSNLFVKNFKSSDETFRASVDDAWVYRKLNVEMNGLNYFDPNGKFVDIMAFVSEADSFIGKTQLGKGPMLFHVSGRLVDVTPSKVVDVEWLTVNDNRLKLSLRDNVTSAPDSDFGGKAFVIDSLWFGEGEETLYLEAPFGDEAKFIQPYKLAVSKISGPIGDEYFIKILAKDENGNEFETVELPLQDLLSNAYDN